MEREDGIIICVVWLGWVLKRLKYEYFIIEVVVEFDKSEWDNEGFEDYIMLNGVG